MFCARCGGAVAPSDKDCTSCGASLCTLGSVRMTSLSDQVPGLDEIFPEMAPGPEPEQEPDVPADLAPVRTVAAGPVRLTTRGWATVGIVVVLVGVLVVLLVH